MLDAEAYYEAERVCWPEGPTETTGPRDSLMTRGTLAQDRNCATEQQREDKTLGKLLEKPISLWGKHLNSPL